MNKTIVWDMPTRVFHWLLTMGFVAAWMTHDDNRFLYIHVFAGYVFLALLVFRLLWGVIGSHYARFHVFAHNWESVQAYLKGLITGEATRYIGHNPIGGWSIFLMIALGFLITIAGMFVLGGEERHGPLAAVIPFAVGSAFKEVHEFGAWTMIIMVSIHVIGVIVESIFHKDNLIWAMVSGYKYNVKENKENISPHNLAGVLILVLIFIAGIFTFKGYLTHTLENPFLPFKGPELPDNTVWRNECGDCHLAFHPTLLPARSWQKMMSQLDDHFGDAVFIDDDTTETIKQFLLTYSAESELSEPAYQINRSTPKSETPLFITKTHYWHKKHKDINKMYWDSELVGSKSNCAACHFDADLGTFEDAAMWLPKL